MRTVTKRELNQNTAGVLAQVTDSEEVVVTERGVAQWCIVRANRQVGDMFARSAAEGRYTPPASDPEPWPDEVDGPEYTSDQVDALVDELRGEY